MVSRHTSLLIALLLVACRGGLVANERHALGEGPTATAPMSSVLPVSACPLTNLGESAQDCPWAAIARDLQITAQQVPAPGLGVGFVLDREAPEVAASLAEDAHYPEWLALWGNVINFDENAKDTVVDPAIIDLMNQRAGVAPRFAAETQPGVSRIVTHAGVQHVYSYLFSTLVTPYGYKRARWVDGSVNRGFGFGAPLLSPSSVNGKLFTNVTYLAGMIAFAQDDRERTVLSGLLSMHPEVVAEAIRNYDFNKLRVRRLTETVELPATKRVVSLRSDFVDFPSATGTANNMWLIYSVQDSSTGRSWLITAFPIGPATLAAVTAADHLGDGKTIITAYNAYVEGVTGASLMGTRRFN
jgi:hypothetical protein